MIESLKSEIAKHGSRAAIISAYRLQNICQDVEDLKGRESLNNFQQFIVNDIYKLDVPDTDFEVRSIIIVATPGASSIQMGFTQHGKSIQAMLPASYVSKNSLPARVENYLNEFLNPEGYHVCYAPRLPHKLIAVRSGLGMYGRNNICYVEGMGSFLNLTPFFSDIPCAEDTWHEIRQMDRCRACQACLKNCPTAAIMPERFLINNERCLTYFNEAGAEWNFPDWIDPSSHHTLYGCLRCQTVCPVDQPYLNSRMEPLEFTEEETAFLLEGKSFELFPESLRQEVEAFEMQEYLGAIPRNLRVLFNNAA